MTKKKVATPAVKPAEPKKSYAEKAAEQKIIAQHVTSLKQYQGLMCNPRWWSIPHIKDVVLLKQIVEVEKTPIILERAKRAIERLDRRAKNQLDRRAELAGKKPKKAAVKKENTSKK